MSDDKTFLLELINNDGSEVEIKGDYEIDGNDIDYKPRTMTMGNKPVSFTKRSRIVEGTIFLVNDMLYFNYADMGSHKRQRLNAMQPEYRNTAKRLK